jgi:hypothetical protein
VSVLIFPDHALEAMARDSITRDDVDVVVGDFDDSIERDDGRTVYTRTVDGRDIVVVIEDDGETVVSAWLWRRRRPRRR